MKGDILDWSLLICEACGEEISHGILEFIAHQEVCKHDAPNESIRKHWDKVESDILAADMEKRNKEFHKRFDKIWVKMSSKEQYEIVYLGACGPCLYDADGTMNIIMGSEAHGRYTDYIDKMTKKYS